MQQSETDALSRLADHARGGNDLVAFVLIKTIPGWAKSVADAVANRGEWESQGMKPSPVHWTAVVWGTAHQVIAAVRVGDAEVFDQVMGRIAKIPGVRNPDAAQVIGGDLGRIEGRPHNGWP